MRLAYSHDDFEDDHDTGETAGQAPLTNLVQQAIEQEQSGQTTPTPSPAPPGQALPFELLSQALDSDRDGLSDIEEENIGTQAQVADSDGDGFLDGVEVMRGYNPLVASPGDELVFDMPAGQMAQSANSSVYKITSVRMGGVGVQSDNLMTVGGVGPANSWVRIFVYSEQPRVWATRTDSTGRFLYTSDEVVSDGDHVAFAASADAAARSREISQPYAFQKTEAGISQPMVSVLPNSPEPINPFAKASNDFDIAWWPLALGVVLAIVIAAGLFIWRRISRRTRSDLGK